MKRLTQRKHSDRKGLGIPKKKPALRSYPAHGARRRAASRTARRESIKSQEARATAERRDSDAEYAAAIRKFETAVRHFRLQRYEKAKEIFDRLATAAPPGVADRAKIHLRLCEQRLAPSAQSLRTTEDYYVTGVSELNARHLARAIEFLAKANKMDSKREETHYALAAAYALQGEMDAAIAHLKTSIELRPQNIYQARRDEDLRSLASDPRFSHLVHPEHGAPMREGA